MSNPTPASEHPTTLVLRRFALGLAALGVLTTPVELYLMHHYNTRDQLAPFIILGMAALAILAVLIWSSSALVMRGFQVVMVLVALGSGWGMKEHLQANARNAQAMGAPASSLLELTFTGSAPLLAPGILAQVGLLGLAFSYRHPVLSRSATRVLRRAPEAVTS